MADNVWFLQQQAAQKAVRRAKRMRFLIRAGILEPTTARRELRLEAELLSIDVPVKRYRMGASGVPWAFARADIAMLLYAKSPLKTETGNPVKLGVKFICVSV